MCFWLVLIRFLNILAVNFIIVNVHYVEVKIEGDCHFDAMQGGAICTSCSQGKQINYPASVRLFIEHLLHLDWDNPPKFQVKGIDLINAEKILLDYIQSLIGKPFKSLTFIKQVTSLS